MKMKKSVLATATIALGLWTSLVGSTFAQSETPSESLPNDLLMFEEPLDLDKPPKVPGGTRAVSCTAAATDPRSLTALMPLTSNNMGVTLSERPEFFVYMPETMAGIATFVLRDEDWNDVYRTEREIVGKGKIEKITIPQTNEPLKAGTYSWNLYLVCPVNGGALGSEVEVGGMTVRREMDDQLKRRLEETTGRDRVRVYAENGIWHEALSTLVQLMEENPDDEQLVQDWQNLLKSVGLEDIASEPVEFATMAENP